MSAVNAVSAATYPVKITASCVGANGNRLIWDGAVAHVPAVASVIVILPINRTGTFDLPVVL